MKSTDWVATASCSVVAITDGDTIKVLDRDKVQHKVRLTGIDAPEKSQPCGKASQKHLASLIAGQTVFVESNKQDRYGRVLGKVLHDEVDVTLEQVKAGYAWWFRYNAKTQPEADRVSYEAAEDLAKADQLGLWADPNPINPYNWRKGRR
jgi:endonuclease YncB( thermonuclease family)